MNHNGTTTLRFTTLCFLSSDVSSWLILFERMQFPTRPVTVDCVVFQGDAVVLIKRGHEPFKGSYALPGGFVDQNETVEEACRRETLEETGLVVENLRMVGVYSDPARDTLRHTIAVAFVAEADLSTMKAGDDAAQVELVNDWQSLPLAFDHRKIIEDAWKIRILKPEP